MVAIDQRGLGLTDHLCRPYHILDGVPDVIRALEILGWDREILLGHSMGGSAATLVMAAYSVRIQQLWLLEGPGPWTYLDGEAPDLLRQSTDRLKQIDDRARPLYESIDQAIDSRVRGGVVPLTLAAPYPIARRRLVRNSRDRPRHWISF